MVGPYPVANRVPLQGAAGCGGRIRFSPKGAVAYGTPRNAVTPPEVRPSSAPPEGGPATRGPRTDKHGRPRLTVLDARAALPASVVLALMQEGFGLWSPPTGRRGSAARPVSPRRQGGTGPRDAAGSAGRIYRSEAPPRSWWRPFSVAPDSAGRPSRGPPWESAPQPGPSGRGSPSPCRQPRHKDRRGTPVSQLSEQSALPAHCHSE